MMTIIPKPIDAIGDFSSPERHRTDLGPPLPVQALSSRWNRQDASSVRILDIRQNVCSSDVQRMNP